MLISREYTNHNFNHNKQQRPLYHPLLHSFLMSWEFHYTLVFGMFADVWMAVREVWWREDAYFKGQVGVEYGCFFAYLVVFFC